MWKNILKIGVPAAVIMLLIGINIYQRIEYKNTQKELLDRIDILTQIISKKDTTISYYSKMVDNFDITERDLRKQLKDQNKEFANKIREADERILSLSEYNIQLKNSTDTIYIKETKVYDDVLNFEIEDYYPDIENYFVKYHGYAQLDLKSKNHTPIIAREFSFRPIKINMVMTETTRGAWKYNLLDAPDWLDVGGIDIKSLPPEQYKPAHERGVQFSVGGGVAKQYQGISYLHLSAGAEYNSWQAVASGSLHDIRLTILKRLTRK